MSDSIRFPTAVCHCSSTEAPKMEEQQSLQQSGRYSQVSQSRQKGIKTIEQEEKGSSV